MEGKGLMSHEPGICDPYVKVSAGHGGWCGVLRNHGPERSLKVQSHLWVWGLIHWASGHL